MKSKTDYINKVTFKCSPDFKATLDALLAATNYTSGKKQAYYKQGLSHFINSLYKHNAIEITKLNTGESVIKGTVRRAGAASNIKQLKILAEGQKVSRKGEQIEVSTLLADLISAIAVVSKHKSKPQNTYIENQFLQSDEVEALKEKLAKQMSEKDYSCTVCVNLTDANHAKLFADKTASNGTREVITTKIVKSEIKKKVIARNDPFAESLNAIYQSLNDGIKQIHILKLENLSYNIDLAKLILKTTNELKALVQNATKT